MLIEDICDIWVPLSFSFPADFHLVLGFCSGWILSQELRGLCHHLQLAVGVLVRSPVPGFPGESPHWLRAEAQPLKECVLSVQRSKSLCFCCL